ncbi:MAG: LysR family transcriptional regulator [Hyphomicrobiales bacterium]
MLAPRRFLPSISLLSAFEAAARTGSFTLAARELDLTQSAVSRQIKALEEQLGATLFIRDRQKIHLTAAGETYARDIREALRMIAGASLGLRANPGGGSLELAILPTFGTRWLAPRLNDFLAAHPGITLHLTTRLEPFDFAVERLDAAIHFGRDDWNGAESVFLMDETVLPVCAPRLRARHGFAAPGDLLGAPLLHLSTRPDAWERWFDAEGVAAGHLTGMVFDQFATMAQAAVHGLGLALLPGFLIEGELADGALVPAIDRPTTSLGAYYLVWPKTRAAYPPLLRFRDWITGAAKSGTRPPQRPGVIETV